jgi:hypothetical protein
VCEVRISEFSSYLLHLCSIFAFIFASRQPLSKQKEAQKEEAFLTGDGPRFSSRSPFFSF